jgi:DNA repair exonuclease SbcCD ATPase subunit
LITFKYVRWRNFLSTGNNFTEIQLDRSNTTLIIGENGAGKSTILDALCFGLFGKPFRPINKSQLINSVNMTGSMVEVEFEIGSKKIKVVRGIKPNVFEIYINGKMYNQDANVRDYQKYLEQQILKLNYRSFTQVVILGSSTFIPFMQLKARHRREVVEEILDIQIFSLMNMILKTRLAGIKTDQKEVEFQSELSSEKIELHEKLINEMKKNNTQIIEEKTNKIKKNIEDINDKKISIEDLNKIDQELLSQITDSDKVNKDLVKLKDIKSTLREKHKSHSDTVNFFKSNEDCPTCEQHIGDLFKKDMILSKDKEVKKFSKALEELDAVLSDNTKRHKEIKSIMDTIRENEVQIAKDNSSIMQLEKFQSTLESEIKSLESQDVNKSDTDKLDELKKISVNLEKERSKLREDQTYGEAVRNMLQDTGIKTKIIKQYLPIMNKLINTYLTAMEFYVNFTLDENFEETIKSRYRDEFSYPSFSEGEKMRIDLALLFTWRAIAKMKNSANTNLLILDEIFDSSLDSGGTDEFLKILNTLGGENVFVISHKQDALVDKFKSTIKFEKIKNFSHVAVN